MEIRAYRSSPPECEGGAADGATTRRTSERARRSLCSRLRGSSPGRDHTEIRGDHRRSGRSLWSVCMARLPLVLPRRRGRRPRRHRRHRRQVVVARLRRQLMHRQLMHRQRRHGARRCRSRHQRCNGRCDGRCNGRSARRGGRRRVVLLLESDEEGEMRSRRDQVDITWSSGEIAPHLEGDEHGDQGDHMEIRGDQGDRCSP